MIAIRASVTVAPVDGDDGRCADDGDLHLAPVLEPEVGAARAVGRSGNLDLDEQLVGRGRRGAGTRPEVVDRNLPRAGVRLQRRRGAEADERAAGLHRGRGVHHVAADRPLRARGVGADDRAGVGERGEAGADVVARGDLAMAREGAEPQASVAERLDAVERGDAVDRDDAVREPRLAGAGADDEVGAARDGRAPAASAATASSTEVAG